MTEQMSKTTHHKVLTRWLCWLDALWLYSGSQRNPSWVSPQCPYCPEQDQKRCRTPTHPVCWCHLRCPALVLCHPQFSLEFCHGCLLSWRLCSNDIGRNQTDSWSDTSSDTLLVPIPEKEQGRTSPVSFISVTLMVSRLLPADTRVE